MHARGSPASIARLREFGLLVLLDVHVKHDRISRAPMGLRRAVGNDIPWGKHAVDGQDPLTATTRTSHNGHSKL